jgi:hypothetical protein
MTDPVQEGLLEAKHVEDDVHQYPGPPAHVAHDVYAGYVPQFEVEPISPFVQVELEVKHEPDTEPVGHQYPVKVLAQVKQVV